MGLRRGCKTGPDDDPPREPIQLASRARRKRDGRGRWMWFRPRNHGHPGPQEGWLMASRSAGSPPTGRATRGGVVPLPGALSTSIWPPWSATTPCSWCSGPGRFPAPTGTGREEGGRRSGVGPRRGCRGKPSSGSGLDDHAVPARRACGSSIRPRPETWPRWPGCGVIQELEEQLIHPGRGTGRRAGVRRTGGPPSMWRRSRRLVQELQAGR